MRFGQIGVARTKTPLEAAGALGEVPNVRNVSPRQVVGDAFAHQFGERPSLRFRQSLQRTDLTLGQLDPYPNHAIMMPEPEGTEMNNQVSTSRDALAEFCREHGIRRLSVFGSALREDFGPESDVDVLVEFEPARTPGLLGVARIELELSELFAGRKVDLRTPEDLSRYFRQEVLDTAEVQIGQG